MADDETDPPENNNPNEPLTDTPPPNDDRPILDDEDDDDAVVLLPNDDDDGDNDNIAPLIPDENDDDGPLLPAHRRHRQQPPPHRKPFYILHYTPLSLLLALLLLWYAFRSRGGQFYPAILFLSSSKLSYCVFGNAIVALSVYFFHVLARLFLGGLRSTESESISEGMRWSMTETCLALTMFREEVSINMVGMFLTLTLGKCLHWAIELRGKHLIQTEEAISLSPAPAEGSSRRRRPIIPLSHVKYVVLVQILFVLDILALGYCVHTCMEEGPSVHLLFGFESVILSLTASHALLLYSLHVVDGTVTIMGSMKWRLAEMIAGVWRDKRFTLTLSIDLFTHAGKFLSYLLFFFLVFTYYGMPINIFRDLYISFQEFKRKILQFISYRRLNRLMHTKFHTVTTEEELEECGKVCIICRDAMSVTDGSKKLPGCGHVFHPYCLKGWLMQQQTCPTCRRDIVKASRELPGEGAAVTPPATPPTPTDTEQPPEEQTSTPPDESSPSQPPPPPSDTSPAFPSFYKITNPEGANVFTLERDVKRTVPVEKLVLCTEMTWWRPSDQEARGEMMLKMPDGWVKDGDVKRIVALPLKVG